MEVWVNVKKYPKYEVSSEGRVRNKKRGNILTPHDNGKGYPQVALSGHTIKVHSVVASTFFDCDSNRRDLEVNHKDGNKCNPFVGNLEGVTHLENMRHAAKTGLIAKPSSLKKRVKISETGEVFNSIDDCARAISGSRGAVSECLSGSRNRKSHKGFHFEYAQGGIKYGYIAL